MSIRNNEKRVLQRVKPALMVVLLTGVLFACTQPEEPKEIRIGVIAPLTGDSDARWGKSYVNGAMLAASSVNKEGGLLVDGQRCRVTLTFADSQGNPQIALNVARKLITRYNVVALVGAPRSQVALPVSALAESRQIPFVSSTATHPGVTKEKRFTFRTIFSDTVQADTLARFAVHDLKIARAAVLFEVTNGDSSSLAGLFKKQFEARGGEIVAYEPYISGDDDWERQLTEIKESGAELLFLPNYGNEVSRQARQARKIGLKVSYLGGDSWWGIEKGKDRMAVEGGFFATDYTPGLISPENERFLKAYRENFKVDPNDNAAHMYDALGLLFAVIAKEKAIDAVSIQKGLETLGAYIGVTGIMHFQGGGDPVKAIHVIQIRDGNFEMYP